MSTNKAWYPWTFGKKPVQVRTILKALSVWPSSRRCLGWLSLSEKRLVYVTDLRETDLMIGSERVSENISEIHFITYL